MDQIRTLPYSEILFKKFLSEHKQDKTKIEEIPNLEKAIRWYYLQRTCFSGVLDTTNEKGGRLGFHIQQMSHLAFYLAIEKLPEIYEKDKKM